MTEDEAKAEIAKLIEEKPELRALQYKIDCRLSHCKTFEERQEVLITLINEQLTGLNEQWRKIFRIMGKANGNEQTNPAI